MAGGEAAGGEAVAEHPRDRARRGIRLCPVRRDSAFGADLVPALKDGGWAVINQVAKLMNASADTVDTAEIDVSLKMSETMKLLGARLGELYRRPT